MATEQHVVTIDGVKYDYDTAMANPALKARYQYLADDPNDVQIQGLQAQIDRRKGKDATFTPQIEQEFLGMIADLQKKKTSYAPEATTPVDHAAIGVPAYDRSTYATTDNFKTASNADSAQERAALTAKAAASMKAAGTTLQSYPDQLKNGIAGAISNGHTLNSPTSSSKTTDYSNFQGLTAAAAQAADAGLSNDPTIRREQIAQRANPTVMQPSQSSGGTNLNLPTADYSAPVTRADAATAGAITGAGDLQKYLDKLQEPTTALSKQEKALTDRLTELYGKDVGKAQAQADAEKQAGVDDMRKQLQDITNAINIKNAEYEKLNTDASGKAIPMGLITGEQAQNKLQQASEINLLLARAQAITGNMTLAIDTATKAVDLQYSKIEEEITARERQLQLIQPALSKEQQKIQNAQQLMLQDQKDAIAEMKDKAKVNVVLAVENGVNTKFANKNGEFFDVNSGLPYATPQEFFKAAGVSSFAEAYARGLVTDVKNSTGTDLKQYPVSYQEYLLAKQEGYTGSYNDYQTADANRKAVRSTTVNNYGIDKATVAKETRVKQIIDTNPSEWGRAADQIDREFGPGTAAQYDALLKAAYAPKREG